MGVFPVYETYSIVRIAGKKHDRLPVNGTISRGRYVSKTISADICIGSPDRDFAPDRVIDTEADCFGPVIPHAAFGLAFEVMEATVK